MKKLYLAALLVVSALMLINPAIAKDITIVGTGSGAVVLKSIGQSFSKIHEDINVIVPKSIGSGGGIKAVGTDKASIGRVARGIKDSEKHYGLELVPYAKMPIVFFVNKNVEITSLSPQQVCDIYGGKITNWRDVGGNDARIKLIRREDGDSSLKVLQKTFPGFGDLILSSKSKTTYSDPETFATAEKVKNAIAFGTYPNALHADVKILDIDGLNPTVSSYAYVGTLSLIFKANLNIAEINQFIAFATSEAAHESITKVGAIPF